MAYAKTLEFRLPKELREPDGHVARGRSVGVGAVGITSASQAARIGSYVLRQHLTGPKALSVGADVGATVFAAIWRAAGCGKIDYPDEILNQRLSYGECMAAMDECGAPPSSRLRGWRATASSRDASDRQGPFLPRKEVRDPLHQRACCWTRRSTTFQPHPSFTWSIHLDGKPSDA